MAAEDKAQAGWVVRSCALTSNRFRQRCSSFRPLEHAQSAFGDVLESGYRGSACLPSAADEARKAGGTEVAKENVGPSTRLAKGGCVAVVCASRSFSTVVSSQESGAGV